MCHCQHYWQFYKRTVPYVSIPIIISLASIPNPCGQLPTVSVMQLYQEGLLGNLPKCQEILGHLLTKPGPSTKNTDKFLANFAEKF